MRKLVIIPGFNYNKRRYLSVFEHFLDYDVKFFPVDYAKNRGEVVDDLSQFLVDNSIEECNFLTHSYGAVIMNKFYKYYSEKVKRVVQLAPPNQGSRVLESLRDWPFLNKVLRVNRDFLKLEVSEYPDQTGVIAGTKNFSFKRPEAYLLKPLFNLENSDGKVYVEETKFEGMEDFFTVDEYHTYMMCNREVLEKAENFLKSGTF